MFVSFNLLGLHSLLKHKPTQFTRKLLAEGLFLVEYNQFSEEHPDIVFFSELSVYCWNIFL